MSQILSEREVWQDRANADGAQLEQVVRDVLVAYLDDMPQYEVDAKPKDLKQIYREKQDVDPNLANWIARPQRPLSALGVEPDLAIRNRAKGATIWVEIKRQKADGNVHERACKYFAPGLVRRAEGLTNVKRPFYFIFAGGMVDTPGKSDKYHAAIDTWFDAPGWEDHVLKWVDHDPVALCQWFEQSIRPALG